MAPSSPAAIIAAGGRGERAAGSGGEPKQFQKLRGRPLIEWSVDLIRAAGCEQIVVAVPPGLVDSVVWKSSSVLDGVMFVQGGESRQESVRNALSRVSYDKVVIHDAARPLADPDLVRRVVAALDEWDGAIAAVPVDETLKLVRELRVESTVDRSGLWQAQTPQAFRTKALRAAHERASTGWAPATDDAALIELNGGRVCVVPSSRANLKITYPEDFALAEALMGSRGT